MAVYINILNGGSITIGSGASPTPPANPKTVITFTDNTTQEFEWSGTITQTTMENAGLVEDSEWIAHPTAITIGNAVTSIGYRAFYGCNHENEFVSITIPDSVTSIGEGAFDSCHYLTNISIPSNVTSIGVEAFIGCAGLTSMTIPASVTSIGQDAFADCFALTTITVLGKTTAQAEALLADASIPEECTIVGELG